MQNDLTQKNTQEYFENVLIASFRALPAGLYMMMRKKWKLKLVKI